MRIPFTLILSLSLTAIVLPPISAFAAEKVTKAPTKVIKRPKAGGTSVMGDAPIALTNSECIRLGGVVSSFSICKSKFVCSRTDEKGNAYEVCITATK